MKKQRGFTQIESLGCLFAIAAVAFWCGVGYVACHFIAKFW